MFVFLDSTQSTPNVLCEFNNFDSCGFLTEISDQNVVGWVIASRDTTSNYTREYCGLMSIVFRPSEFVIMWM
jgi:hypothetical protein